jgi:uncharacterized protein
MTTIVDSPSRTSADLHAAIDAALARIPPLWPLRHFVAVNPFLGWVNRPFCTASAILQRVAGAAPLQGADEYRQAFQSGQIQPEDLEDAADEEWTSSALLEALKEAATGSPLPIPTFADFLDRERAGARWSGFIIDEISKWCGVVFDENQTTWTSPWKGAGLYEAWRAAALHDRNPETYGLADFRAFVSSLPAHADAAIAQCLALLAPCSVDLADFLHRQLSTISGWAGYVQYLVREDALRGCANSSLKQLLAIRLAYDAALLRAFSGDTALQDRWRKQSASVVDARILSALTRWQFAYETGYQRRLATTLAAQPSVGPSRRPSAQAVFCIDVRSEVLRRHLENALPGVQTIGFAGFFGFPLAHQSEPTQAQTPRCPVLLSPPLKTSDSLSERSLAAARASHAAAGTWKAIQNSATSCFSFVEALGLGFATSLFRRAKPSAPSCSRPAPVLQNASLDTKAEVAAGALRNMSLARNFARIVLFCGHGSKSANNPYASGLDCGACGGHAGDVNARVAAATLNDPDVRVRLVQKGITIPADTLFVAGLHTTTTDEVVLFDVENIPESHRRDVAQLSDALAMAGAAARRERASSLGLKGVAGEKLDRAVRIRATDIAQVRPEWGLANNAAFVAAPRSRTAGLKLDGRVFLHDYEASLDPDDKVLTLILSAPVVVASWINLQYYASRVDPQRYGSGNKVLHNVVGGLGVLEGNGGDLKVGLPLQSIHNGVEFVHEPRRLAVYIEAEAARIATVLEKNPSVLQLFENEWMHLFCLQGAECFRFRKGRWVPAAGGTLSPAEELAECVA